jgi:ubiquitin-like protein Pup
MAEQDRTTTRRKTPDHEAEEAEKKTDVGEKGERLKKGIDDILEEIDSVLEENAEEFVKSYVQRGGE